MNKFMHVSNEVLPDSRQGCRSFAATWWSPDLAASPSKGWSLFTLNREFIPGLNCARQYPVFIGQFLGSRTLSPHPSQQLQSLQGGTGHRRRQDATDFAQCGLPLEQHAQGISLLSWTTDCISWLQVTNTGRAWAKEGATLVPPTSMSLGCVNTPRSFLGSC